MRADRRLFASSAVKLTQADIDAVLAALSCPVLNIWASEGIKSTRPKVAAFAELARERIATYETHDVDGHHHFHMVPEAAQTIAGLILDFLKRHHL
jgi:pimeloyl-ACP methyl ester carboxylesterase